MPFEFLWWHWIVAGSVLVAVDIFLINIYYLVWFGVGALSVGVVLAAFPAVPPWSQIALFGGLSVLLLAIWLRMFSKKINLSQAAKELPGQSGVVVRFNRNQGRGQMRLQRPIAGKDIWEFAAQTPPNPGDRLVVADVDKSGLVRIAPPPPEKE